MSRDGKTPCDTRLMYRPSTGEPSWGAYYMTAPASWIVYDALLDFFYDPADGVLRLRPFASGTFPVIHPLFWGICERQGGRTQLTVRRTFSKGPLPVRDLELEHDLREVLIDGQRLNCRSDQNRNPRFRLDAPCNLEPGATVVWERT